MVSVNLEAKKTVDVMIEKADELNIEIVTLDNGATVLDCGVNVDGSFKAGELYTKVCLGGLADVGISIPGDAKYSVKGSETPQKNYSPPTPYGSGAEWPTAPLPTPCARRNCQ